MSRSASRPRMATHGLDLPALCDICHRPRSTGKHDKCSKTRQQRMNAHWQSVMDNQAAKKLQQAKGLRPLR